MVPPYSGNRARARKAHARILQNIMSHATLFRVTRVSVVVRSSNNYAAKNWRIRGKPPGAAAGGAGVAAGELAAVTLAACCLEDSRQTPRRRRRRSRRRRRGTCRCAERAPPASPPGDLPLCRKDANNPHDFMFWRIRSCSKKHMCRPQTERTISAPASRRLEWLG